VTEAKLLDQEGVIAKQADSVLRAGEWGDWVGLWTVAVRLRNRVVHM
jgi:hypothetical protein